LDRIRRVDFDGTLTTKQIAETLTAFVNGGQMQHYVDNLRYYVGDNPPIQDREIVDPAAPDNKVPISYARKIVNTVLGYMYKPGLVRYAAEDEAYMASLQEVFDVNAEPIKTSRLGKQTSIQGVGYEYYYLSEVGDKAIPRFTVLPAASVIPLYDFNVEPELKAFIYFYERGQVVDITVYYDVGWERYETKGLTGDISLKHVESGAHPFGQVPLVVYFNNEEQVGDFDPVKPIIDSYDVLISDSMNEFDRFAQAYLIIKGFALSPDQAKSIKIKRAFDNLQKDDAVNFLTKDVPSEFITFMAGQLRSEIHNQSGIPDVSDIKFGAAASGTTIDKFIYLMELFTDPKEALFRQGLEQRIEMINGILRVKAMEPSQVEITMTRNLPQDDLKNANTMEKYAGRISQKTLLSNFAPFVKDVDAELEALAEEKESAMDLFNLDTPVDEEGDDAEIDNQE